MRTAALLLAIAGVAWCGGVLPAVDIGQLNAALQDDGAARPDADGAADRWVQLLQEWARERGQKSVSADLVKPFRYNLRLDKDGPLPVLVLPLVVPSGEAPPTASASAAASVSASKSAFAPGLTPAFAPGLKPEFAPRFTPPAASRVLAPPRPPVPTDPPQMETSASSSQLVAQFRLEGASAQARLPPALVGAPPAPPAPRAAPPAPPAPTLPTPPPLPPAPPRPRWDRSLRMRADLRVFRADYTEPYIVWWDASSGASRVELHDGATTTLQQLLPDGTHQRVEYRIDNTGPASVARCGFALPSRPPPDELGPPGLPDPTDFEFAGYSSEEGGRAEVWRQRVEGAAGEGGAARGEVLTFRHELLVLRDRDGAALPLRYRLDVDSSLLGERCDGYEHRYREVQLAQPDPNALQLDAGGCGTRDLLAPEQDLEHAARLRPLREFTLPARDTRYDVLLDRYKKEFSREYMDDKEEAVRKNIFIQSTRFVLSGNRQGASFELGANFLADRLGAELGQLLGVSEDASDVTAEAFPYSDDEMRRLGRDLPQAFDWRDEGGVSEVRFQGSCSSCWAVSVTGAVEGALFARTRRLVPLAEQALVDCAAPFGGHGCGNTWPSFAYDYVKARGLPPLAQYGPHKEKVEQCRDARVAPATHISGHVNVTAGSVSALKLAIRNHSPAVVIIDAMAKSFIFYKTGVLYDDRCEKTSSNHAVLAVGWGAEGGQEYFTLKNSWSAAWAEGGYVRLHAASNACGVLSRPSYPRLDQPDVGDQRASRRNIDKT